MFDHLARWDYSKKGLNIGFGEEIGITEIEIGSLSGALLVLKIDPILR